MGIHPDSFYRALALTTVWAVAPSAAPAARAQESSTEEPEQARQTQQSEEIVVTGARIRGVVPVGAAVIPVSRQEIEKSGVTNAADLLRKIPQVLSFGGNQRQAGGRSFPGAELNTQVLGVQNLFDADPPLVLNNSSLEIMFDNAYANPMGRMASLQVSERF